METERLSSIQAAAYLGYGVDTLYRWRAQGCAPVCRRINGGHPKYLREDLDAFLRQRCTVVKPRRVKR